MSRLRELTRGGAVALWLLWAVTLALAVVEIQRPRAQIPPGHGLASGDASGASVLRPRESIAFPISGSLPGTLGFATDSDLHGGSALWLFTRDKRRLYVQRWRLRGERFEAEARHRIGGSPGRGLVADVARWQGEDAAFLVRPAGARFAVEVWSMDAASRRLASGVTPPVPRNAAQDRSLAIATWDGADPDLIIVDRSRRSPAMTIQVISGESSFRRESLSVTNALATFPSREWNLDAGSVNTPKADIALFSRGQATGSRRTEVHVIIGPVFQSFGERSGLGLTSAAAAGRQFLIAHVNGLPVAYAVDPRGRRIDVLTL